jgi:hypothetical protein
MLGCFIWSYKLVFYVAHIVYRVEFKIESRIEDMLEIALPKTVMMNTQMMK